MWPIYPCRLDDAVGALLWLAVADLRAELLNTCIESFVSHRKKLPVILYRDQWLLALGSSVCEKKGLSKLYSRGQSISSLLSSHAVQPSHCQDIGIHCIFPLRQANCPGLQRCSETRQNVFVPSKLLRDWTTSEVEQRTVQQRVRFDRDVIKYDGSIKRYNGCTH